MKEGSINVMDQQSNVEELVSSKITGNVKSTVDAISGIWISGLLHFQIII